MTGQTRITGQNGILQMIMDNSKEFVWAIDKSYCLLFANRAFQDALRAAGQEEMKPGNNVMETQYPEDFIRFWKNNYDRCFRGESFEILSMSPHTNEVLYLENTFRPLIDDSGRQSGVFVISREITEKKKTEMSLAESEERFRSYIENAPLGIFVADEDGNYLMVNAWASEISGYSKEELLQMNIRDIVHPAEVKHALGMFKTSLSKGNLISERRILAKDGSLRNWLIKAVKMNDSKLVGFVTDITAQKQAEEALLRNENLLKESNAAKDSLLSIIAHDLKNPFATLLGYADLLYENLRTYDIYKIESHVNIMRKTIHHTYDLLEDMLLWSQSQSGRLPYEPERVFIGEVCSEVLEIMSDLAEAKNINLLYFEPRQIEIMADVNMFKSILRNLISNAIKFSYKNGEVKIYIESDDTEAVIVVSDKGVGISKEKQEKLFTLTHPERTTGTANEKGTGFGLLLCSEFVKKHGGRIWVESAPGQGSKFKFSLPVNLA